MKSKEIFDYSRNIINFTKKKVLHDCNIKKNLNISCDFPSTSKDNKDLNNNLYMKVDNILNRFQHERINNFLKFTNHLDKYSKSVNFFKEEDDSFKTSLSKIRHNYNKTFGGLPPPKTPRGSVELGGLPPPKPPRKNGGGSLAAEKNMGFCLGPDLGDTFMGAQSSGSS